VGESSPAAERLACGHTTGELVEHLAGEAAPEFAAHAAGCPHCSAALAELAPGWSALRRATEVSVDAPSGLLDRALRTARRARGRESGDPAEIPQDCGALRVAPRATLVLARRLSAQLIARRPAARLLSCTGDGREVRVELRVGYGTPIPELVAGLQAELATALRDVLGAAAPVVHVRVVDVAPAHEP